jgi:hypothetical protein
MKKNLASHFKLAEKMGKKYEQDENGPMPEIEGFLEMRSNEVAFRFFMCVFGPTIYGSLFLVDVYAPGKLYEDAATVFTENDESFALFLLEDNWGVWYQSACNEFKEEATEMRLDLPEMLATDMETSTDSGASVAVSESGDNAESEDVDVLGYDGETYRRRFSTKRVLVQKYSHNGMTNKGFSRLEELEVLVATDRERNGKVFYTAMKQVLLKEDALGKGGKKNVATTRKKLRMK